MQPNENQNISDEKFPVQKQSKKDKFKVLVNELRGITTIDLAFKSASFVEKTIWLLILLIGTVWVFYFIALQFEIWCEQPSIVTNAENVKLSDLNYPAMTFCSKVVFPQLVGD